MTTSSQRLKFVAALQNSKVPYAECERPYIGLENIESWTSRLTGDEQTEPDGTVSLFERNDVLFGKLRPYLAKVFLATAAGACSTEALVLRARSTYWPSFLKYVLLEPNRIGEINASTFGAQMPRASWDVIGTCRVPVPDLDTQKAIVRYLDRETTRIDQLIEKKERQVEVLIDQRTGVIRDLVRNGLTSKPDLTATGNQWFRTVPRGWKPHRMRHLFHAAKRQGMPELDVLSVYREFGVIFKSSRDDNINKTPEDLSSYQLVEPGDLVVNKMKAWQGSLGISPLQGITSPDYLVYRPLAPMVGRFMHHFLRAQPMPSMYLTISNGIRTDQWRLEHAKFMDVVLWLPSIEEQVKIAEAIDVRIAGTNRLITSVSSSIGLLRQRRAALISTAVTGQFDIREKLPVVTAKSDRNMFRLIVGTEIVDRHRDMRRFGRIKNQKLLYLAEAHAGISELGGNYIRFAAGPYDEALIKETERGMEAAAYYRAQPANGDSRGVTYVPLAKAGQHGADLKTLLGDRTDALRRLIDLLHDFDTETVEAIATLYAVWNDALMTGETPDDAALIRGVLREWHPDKMKFTEDALAHWIDWMRRTGLVPRGQGPRTAHTMTRDLFA